MCWCAVTKLVETVKPTVDFSYHKYLQAHDVVVASEAYNTALETASAIIHKVAACLKPPACMCRPAPIIIGVGTTRTVLRVYEMRLP